MGTEARFHLGEWLTSGSCLSLNLVRNVLKFRQNSPFARRFVAKLRTKHTKYSVLDDSPFGPLGESVCPALFRNRLWRSDVVCPCRSDNGCVNCRDARERRVPWGLQ